MRGLGFEVEGRGLEPGGSQLLSFMRLRIAGQDFADLLGFRV